MNSGETVVLGGLIRETANFTKAGIPLLHELPRADHGFLGLELSPYAPLVVVAANAVWGLLLPQVMRAMRGLGPVLT